MVRPRDRGGRSSGSRGRASVGGGLARLEDARSELRPIDHGFCLPEALEPPYFEWLHWPQVWEHVAPGFLSAWLLARWCATRSAGSACLVMSALRNTSALVTQPLHRTRCRWHQALHVHMRARFALAPLLRAIVAVARQMERFACDC